MKDFKLDNEPKISSGFSTPDGYFDAFSEKMLEQIPEQESKVISIFSTRRILYYAAAAVVLLMISLPLYTRYADSQNEIDSATLENYITYSTISEDEILSLLEQEDLDQMKTEFNIEDSVIEDVLKSNSNLEEYIID